MLKCICLQSLLTNEQRCFEQSPYKGHHSLPLRRKQVFIIREKNYSTTPYCNSSLSETLNNNLPNRWTLSKMDRRPQKLFAIRLQQIDISTNPSMQYSLVRKIHRLEFKTNPQQIFHGKECAHAVKGSHRDQRTAWTHCCRSTDRFQYNHSGFSSA